MMAPTARKDAETAERDRWIQLLANLLRSTDTPMGKVDQGKSEQYSAAQGRSPCRNSQVEGSICAEVPRLAHCFARHQFSGSLAAADGVSPRSGYSEPCVRGALKLVHSSYIFLQEVSGIEDKLTDSAMYAVSLKELLSQASPGRPPRQAPRFPTILLAAFEEMGIVS